MEDETAHLIMSSSTKRQRSIDSDDTDDELDQYWPRFLVMVPSPPDSDCLQKLSPFAIAKGIQGIAGEPKSVKKMQKGILIEVEKRPHALNLLRTTSFVNLAVSVTEHRTLNSCKGVIRCRDLAGLPEEDIARELHSQKVTYVKRIVVERGTKPTDTYILTFQSTEVPKTIKVGYLNVRVDIYIPNPLRCFNCQMYGHGTTHCKGKVRCSKCGEDHSSTVCTSEKPHCVHCKAEHSASDRTCPRYVREKLISRIKHTENISFPEARRRVENSQPSYATVAATASRAKATLVTSSTQTEYYWPNLADAPSLTPPPPRNASTSTSIQTDPSSSSQPIQTTPPTLSTQASQKTPSSSVPSSSVPSTSVQSTSVPSTNNRPPSAPTGRQTKKTWDCSYPNGHFPNSHTNGHQTQQWPVKTEDELHCLSGQTPGKTPGKITEPWLCSNGIAEVYAQIGRI